MLVAASTLASPRPNINGAARLLQIGGKRVVAASVEEDDAGRDIAQHLLQHEVELDRLEIEIGFGSELGVHGSKKVLAVDLEPVTGIIEEADIGAGKDVGESADALLHVTLRQIDAVDDFKAEVPQLRGHVAGIVAGIGKARNVRVGGIADNEGDALLRRSRSERCNENCKSEARCRKRFAHEGLPPHSSLGRAAGYL
jgi:hypothetical protein